MEWVPADFCTEQSERVQVAIEDRTVHVRAWQYDVHDGGGHVIPVLLLDTDLEENSAEDRTLTHRLYGGDERHRLCQEVVLGIGGIRMLRVLGYRQVVQYHMNEGHAALLGLELLDERAKSFQREIFTSDDVQAVRRQCVFTTHTPVPTSPTGSTLELGRHHHLRISLTNGYRDGVRTVPVFAERLPFPATKYGKPTRRPSCILSTKSTRDRRASLIQRR